MDLPPCRRLPSSSTELTTGRRQRKSILAAFIAKMRNIEPNSKRSGSSSSARSDGDKQHNRSDAMVVTKGTDQQQQQQQQGGESAHALPTLRRSNTASPRIYYDWARRKVIHAFSPRSSSCSSDKEEAHLSRRHSPKVDTMVTVPMTSQCDVRPSCTIATRDKVASVCGGGDVRDGSRPTAIEPPNTSVRTTTTTTATVPTTTTTTSASTSAVPPPKSGPRIPLTLVLPSSPVASSPNDSQTFLSPRRKRLVPLSIPSSPRSGSTTDGSIEPASPRRVVVVAVVDDGGGGVAPSSRAAMQDHHLPSQPQPQPLHRTQQTAPAAAPVVAVASSSSVPATDGRGRSIPYPRAIHCKLLDDIGNHKATSSSCSSSSSPRHGNSSSSSNSRSGGPSDVGSEEESEQSILSAPCLIPPTPLRPRTTHRTFESATNDDDNNKKKKGTGKAAVVADSKPLTLGGVNPNSNSNANANSNASPHKRKRKSTVTWHHSVVDYY